MTEKPTDLAALPEKWRERAAPSAFAVWASAVRQCADELTAALSAQGAPQEPLREAVVTHLDMLMVDRLQTWARNIDAHGRDISHWGDPQFVARLMCEIADGIHAVISATPALPPAPTGEQK